MFFLCFFCEQNKFFVYFFDIFYKVIILFILNKKGGDHVIQSIQTGTLNVQANSTTLQTNKVAATTTADSQATSKQDDNTSSDGDTVNLSEEGLFFQKTFAAYSSTSTANGGSGVTEGSSTDASAGMLASAAASAGIDQYTSVKNENSAMAAATSSSSSSTSTSSTSTTESLTQYSDYELKQMLEDGEITQAEYDDAIAAKHESDTEEDSTTSASTSNSVSTDSTEA